MMKESWIRMKYIFLLILTEVISVHGTSEMCTYVVTKSDNSTEKCAMNECSKYIDLFSVMVEPKTCKTSLLVLSFSSYENFVLFRDQLQWNIGNLFPSERIDQNRQLILFLDKLNSNDRPFDHDQLVQLGNNIDYYILYVKNIENPNSYDGLIHYDPSNPLWNILQVKLYDLCFVEI